MLALTLLLGGVSCLAIPLSYAQEYSIAQDFKFGYCPITGNQIIDESGRILPNYAIVWFELDNGSKMPLAVDKESMITEADFTKIMDWVRAGWMYEINEKKWTPKEIQHYKDTYFGLKIVRIIK